MTVRMWRWQKGGRRWLKRRGGNFVTRRELKRLSELACASISTRASIGVKKIALP